MADHDVAERTAPEGAQAEEVTTYLPFLQTEFPDWEFEIARTDTWSGDTRPLWVAHRDGHHPQSELTAAKLHTRLSNYLEREAHRRSFAN
jgi:hypothetical protein